MEGYMEADGRWGGVCALLHYTKVGVLTRCELARSGSEEEARDRRPDDDGSDELRAGAEVRHGAAEATTDDDGGGGGGFGVGVGRGCLQATGVRDVGRGGGEDDRGGGAGAVGLAERGGDTNARGDVALRYGVIIRPVVVTGRILDTPHDGLAGRNVDLPVHIRLVRVVLSTSDIRRRVLIASIPDGHGERRLAGERQLHGIALVNSSGGRRAEVDSIGGEGRQSGDGNE